jgi:hypothetical protein
MHPGPAGFKIPPAAFTDCGKLSSIIRRKAPSIMRAESAADTGS